MIWLKLCKIKVVFNDFGFCEIKKSLYFLKNCLSFVLVMKLNICRFVKIIILDVCCKYKLN